jgi:hypothetical protein
MREPRVTDEPIGGKRLLRRILDYLETKREDSRTQ